VLADGTGGGVAVHDRHLTLWEEGRVSTGEAWRKGRERERTSIRITSYWSFSTCSTHSRPSLTARTENCEIGEAQSRSRGGRREKGRTHLHLPQRFGHDFSDQRVVLRQQNLDVLGVSSLFDRPNDLNLLSYDVLRRDGRSEGRRWWVGWCSVGFVEGNLDRHARALSETGGRKVYCAAHKFGELWAAIVQHEGMQGKDERKLVNLSSDGEAETAAAELPGGARVGLPERGGRNQYERKREEGEKGAPERDEERRKNLLADADAGIFDNKLDRNACLGLLALEEAQRDETCVGKGCERNQLGRESKSKSGCAPSLVNLTALLNALASTCRIRRRSPETTPW
jgi:hypothetical protein